MRGRLFSLAPSIALILQKGQVGACPPQDELELGKVPDHTAKKTNIDLAFVALRDIRAGEELFVDYGDEWAGSWLVYTEGSGRYSTNYFPCQCLKPNALTAPRAFNFISILSPHAHSNALKKRTQSHSNALKRTHRITPTPLLTKQ